MQREEQIDEKRETRVDLNMFDQYSGGQLNKWTSPCEEGQS